jgi:hypothetical protein
MANHRGITRRPGSANWYVRVQVPLDSQEAVGRKGIWKSLKTPDRMKAKNLAPSVTAMILREIAEKVRQAPRIPTREELHQAVRQFYLDEVEADIDERAHEPEMARSRQRADPQRYRRYQELLCRDMIELDYSHVEDDVQFLLDHEGMALQPGSALYLELRQLMMRARLEAAKRWSEHDAAIFGETSSNAFFKEAKPRPAPVKASPTSGKTLLELFEDFAKAKATTP